MSPVSPSEVGHYLPLHRWEPELPQGIGLSFCAWPKPRDRGTQSHLATPFLLRPGPQPPRGQGRLGSTPGCGLAACPPAQHVLQGPLPSTPKPQGKGKSFPFSYPQGKSSGRLCDRGGFSRGAPHSSVPTFPPQLLGKAPRHLGVQAQGSECCPGPGSPRSRDRVWGRAGRGTGAGHRGPRGPWTCRPGRGAECRVLGTLRAQLLLQRSVRVGGREGVTGS